MLDAIRNGCNRIKAESPAPLPMPYDSFAIYNSWLHKRPPLNKLTLAGYNRRGASECTGT
jgi:hypothetical protein